MKITFDINCTPEEARRFMGLPDLTPMQDKILKEMENKMLENMRSLEPETFMKTWMPLTLENWTEMQKLFWAQMGIEPAKAAPRKKTGS
ncbi:MAG: hypothetical protein H6867_02285 [Rhodospirillales bacterium]|nr:hypothetical protein [Rhodospirillales bacterium]MCB9997016.1 hypothetical protein [Rhodospirillales bacterium]